MLEAARAFAEEVREKLSAVSRGEPEDQVRAPFERLIRATGKEIGQAPVVPKGETLLADRLGKPDYAIHVAGVLNGYAELKAPGTGANVKKFRGRNRQQWDRFAELPNILYTDGEEWALYRSGDLTGEIVRFSDSVEASGRQGLSDFLCKWPLHHAGTRSGNTIAKWFSAALQSCTGRVQRSLAFMIAR